MNNSTIVFLINDDVRAVKGIYEDGGSAEIFKTFDQSIDVDDLAVVESGTRHEMTVVKIVETDVELDFDTTKTIKWVVQRIDQDAHNEVLAQEQAAISAVQSAERKRKRDELRASMFAQHEDQLKTLSLAHLAEDDKVTE